LRGATKKSTLKTFREGKDQQVPLKKSKWTARSNGKIIKGDEERNCGSASIRANIEKKNKPTTRRPNHD